jgi:hypothetical protein
MKAYGGVDVYIHIFLTFGTSWWWVVSFTPRPLYPRGKSPLYPLDRNQSQSGWHVEKRKFLTLPGLKLRPLGHPACSQSLYRLSYPGSLVIEAHKNTKIQSAIQSRKHYTLPSHLGGRMGSPILWLLGNALTNTFKWRQILGNQLITEHISWDTNMKPTCRCRINRCFHVNEWSTNISLDTNMLYKQPFR